MSIFGDNPLGNASTDAAPATPPASVEAPPAPSNDSPPVDPGPAVAPVSEVPVAPEVAYFNPDEYKDHLVKLKVSGEDVELPLHEALASAMRGQDYTRKTQELARVRRDLSHADALMAMLDNDPQNTVRQLAEMYDLDASTLQPVQRAPEEQANVERQRQLARQEQALQQQRIQYEMNRLMNDYGLPEGDIPRVAEFAYNRGIDLETAYKAMQFDQLRTQQAEQARTTAAQEAARRAQVVHQGGSGQGGAAPAPAPTAQSVKSIRDAWALTKQQLKLN